MSSVKGISETALYVDDMRRSVEFYQRVFGFPCLLRPTDCRALRVAPLQMLLIVRKGATVDPLVTPEGTVPPHDGSGQLHVAFAVPARRLNEWRATLEGHGVENRE